VAAPVHSLIAVTGAGADSATSVAAGANYHRGVCVMSGWSGPAGAAVLVQIEVSLDNAVWVPLPGGGLLGITGSGTFELPSQECAPFPAIAARLNVTAWPADIAGTLDGYVISN
jgi:hypothetical protein